MGLALPPEEDHPKFMWRFSAISRRKGNRIISSSGAGDGNRADTRSAVSLNDPVDDQRLTNPVVTRAAEIQRTRTGSLASSAPFCPRVKFLSVHPSGRWLVGAVGIEPTTNGLKGRCSTTELRPYGSSEHHTGKRRSEQGAGQAAGSESGPYQWRSQRSREKCPAR